MMPELDGFGLLSALRDNPGLAEVPVIVLTAKELTPTEMRFLRDRGGVVIAKGPDAHGAVLTSLREVTG
jgi:threonine synthase